MSAADRTAEPMAVTVAVLTYRRPDDLAAVLPLLTAQADEQTAAGHRVEVLVVDNDPAGSGRAVVAGHRAVRYACEPEPGIAAARNRALTEAAASDLLVFIDDDERPHPGWLGHLLRTRERTGAALVAGTVVSAFPREPDPFVAAGDFFRRRRLATGTPITVAATNNLLLDVRAVRARQLRFDPAFGLSGGEDTLFTRQLGRSGALMVWCAEAVVTDSVPEDRLTARWVLQRALSSGNSVARVELALAGGPVARLRARVLALGRGAPRVLGGLARAGLGLATGSPGHRARGLRSAARGTGMVLGALGTVYREYRRTSGSEGGQRLPGATSDSARR
ncbi:glycosyltransferase family 2 protein [Modestobacter sp. SYSU DS0511]